MKRVTLRRTEMGDAGTFGVLIVDGKEFKTGELPWRDNKRGKSCVPAGIYRVSWQPSGKYGHKYELQGVKGRSDILIHAANLVGDEDLGYKAQVDGCIALGYSRGLVEKQPAVVRSRDAVKDFEDMMGLEDFELEIIDEYLEAGVPGSNIA